MFQKSVTAAVALAGVDLISSEPYRMDTRARVIEALALVGSTAISDCAVEIFVGDKKVAEIRNTTAGASKVPTDADMQSCDIFVPPNRVVMAKMVSAAATNAVVFGIKFGSPKKGFRRNYRPYGQYGGYLPRY